MVGIQNFEIFLLACITLNLTPGNDTIYILSRSIGQGRNAGIMSVLGIATGSIIHTTLAALGLSIIIARSILLFNIIKTIGVIYLIYIGIRMLLVKSSAFKLNAAHKTEKKYKIYLQGVFTNVLNPKVALFFISFLPQFINPGYPQTYYSFLFLGLTFTATGTLWCFVMVYFSSYIFKRLHKRERFSNVLIKICGSALVALGIKLAFTKRSYEPGL